MYEWCLNSETFSSVFLEPPLSSPEAPVFAEKLILSPVVNIDMNAVMWGEKRRVLHQGIPLSESEV